MTRGRKPAELLPGETYARGFRRVAEEARRLRFLLPKARAGVRLKAKAKRMQVVIHAAQNYCDARESEEYGATASRHREALWARLQYALRMYNRAERQSLAGVILIRRRKDLLNRQNSGKDAHASD